VPVSSTTQAASSEQAFSDAWEAFFRAVRRQRAQHNGSDGCGSLSVAQLSLLGPLEAEPAKVKDLAAAAQVSAPTATRMLDGLAKHGLVERHHTAEDRRCVLVALTEDGRRAVDTKRREVQEKRRKIAALLDDEDRAQATRLLQRLTDAMEDL
jgi:DNA-binding MarR family transcriptional regulator